MSSTTSKQYHFFLSQNSASATSAIEEIKSHLGDTAGLIAVPYFPLPPYGEPFAATEERFLQLRQVVDMIEDSNEAAASYWFAAVLPEDKGGRTEYLTLDAIGEKKLLLRERVSEVCRYVSAVFIEDE